MAALSPRDYMLGFDDKPARVFVSCWEHKLEGETHELSSELSELTALHLVGCLRG